MPCLCGVANVICPLAGRCCVNSHCCPLDGPGVSSAGLQTSTLCWSPRMVVTHVWRVVDWSGVEWIVSSCLMFSYFWFWFKSYWQGFGWVKQYRSLQGSMLCLHCLLHRDRKNHTQVHSLHAAKTHCVDAWQFPVEMALLQTSNQGDSVQVAPFLRSPSPTPEPAKLSPSLKQQHSQQAQALQPKSALSTRQSPKKAAGKHNNLHRKPQSVTGSKRSVIDSLLIVEDDSKATLRDIGSENLFSQSVVLRPPFSLF